MAALLLLLIGFGLAFEWPKGTDDPAGTTTTAQRPTTTEAEHGVGPGLQPDVTYNVKDAPNTTPELDAALADLGPVLAPLGATPVVQTTGFPALESTPATARFQANRGDFDQVKGCAGFLSRPMTLTGQWTRTVVPSADVKVILLVWQFANRAQADEAYVALSLGQNPPAESCRGFSEKWGVDDYDELDVSHQDPPLPGLPQGVRYNSFGGPATPEIPVGHLNAIAQDGDTLVVLTSTASPAHGPLDPAVAAAVMTNVLDRVS